MVRWVGAREPRECGVPVPPRGEATLHRAARYGWDKATRNERVYADAALPVRELAPAQLQWEGEGIVR